MTRPLHLRTLGGLLLTGPDGAELLRRRIDLALLAVVADRSPLSVKREELQALFWGERTEDKARHSLRQVVMRLRQACGDALEVSGGSVRLVGGEIDVDVRSFIEAATAGRWRDAIDLWTGPFLPECEDLGIEGFRTWLEVERERLRRLLAHSYERAVDEAAADSESTAVLTSKWVKQFPTDKNAARRHIESLCAVGRVAEAAAAQGAFVRRLREELEETPSVEWTTATNAALESARATDAIAPPIVAAAIPQTHEVRADSPTVAMGTRHRSIFRWVGIAAALGVVAVGALSARKAMARSGQLPALAIGDITSTLPRDSARGFATLLTIDLARISALNVISERRVSEVAATHATEGIEAVARAAGARELIEGVLSRHASGTLRADLRRIDLETGKTQAAYALEARDLTELADLITEDVARDFGVQARTTRREGITGSIVAYRLYEQGLRAYYDGDRPAARRFFTGALAEDSTFAMAAYYVALSTDGFGGDEYFNRAARLAQRTSDRERLVISAALGRRMTDPRVFAWAETLVTRYPSEPEAHLIYAQEMLTRRNLSASLAHYRRVVEVDSANRGTGPTCRACEGIDGMLAAYARMDSAGAAERLARTWVRWQPRLPGPWGRLSDVLGRAHRYPEAHAAIDSAAKYANDPLVTMMHAIWWIRTNDFAEIDRLCQELLRSPKPDVREDALWTGVISLRTQGRVREALAMARRYRRERAPAPTGDPGLVGALLEAVTLLESGEPRRSAALFDSIARVPQAPFPSRVGAHRALHWTYAASAYAAAGDTSELGWLEDSVRVNGALATERHKLLYHYVHGLRLAARHRPTEAAEAFRAAVFDGQTTYVRTYLALGRALLEASRPKEAIGPLVTALEGPTSAAGLYATRTELQELLGHAYERSGQRDSAVVQYRLAADAWRKADPQFIARRTLMESRIAALTAVVAR